MKEFSIWTEKYRPQRIEDLIASDALTSFLQQLKIDQNLPNLLFSGSAGTGKTTTAKVIINELNLTRAFRFLNCSMDTSINDIRNKVKGFASTYSLDDSNIKVCVLDEVDRLSPQAMDSLKGFIEDTYKICRFIFITNHLSKIIPPLLSRLQHFSFGDSIEDAQKIKKKMLARSFDILKEEEIEFDLEVTWDIVQELYPDYRAVINSLQKASKAFGEIDERAINILDSSKINEVIKVLKDRKYSHMRDLASRLDPSGFYGAFYEHMESILQDSCKPDIIYILAKGSTDMGVAVYKEVVLFESLLSLAKAATWKT